jgi:phosphoglycolate phosphatase
MPPLSTREVLNAVGRGAGLLISQTLNLQPNDKALQDSLLKEFRAHYAAHQGTRSCPYIGIEDAIVRLGGTADLYVLSNKPVDATIREMNLANIAHCFKQIWGGGSFTKLKPDPMGVHEAMRLSGASPKTTIMIGDLFVDMETAARAGVSSIFVSWGFGFLRDLQHTPTAVAFHPSNLVDIVASILEK